jgi:hypothetical protein
MREIEQEIGGGMEEIGIRRAEAYMQEWVLNLPPYNPEKIFQFYLRKSKLT